jgi:hypothetical protein
MKEFSQDGTKIMKIEILYLIVTQVDQLIVNKVLQNLGQNQPGRKHNTRA